MRKFSRKKTGSVRAKKKVIDGITFASSLEAYTYNELKSSGLDFDYEGESFVILPSFKFLGTYLSSSPKKKELTDKTGKAVRSITYTPDFVSHTHKFIIETKGFVPSNHSFPLRWKLFLAYLNDNDMGDYSVFIPKNQGQVDDLIKTLTTDEQPKLFK
tara:strand:- start:339 stop:812 length:474 start_codon:yes stop_codon:yes gene_type:complete